MYYLIGHLVLEIHLVVLLHFFNYTNKQQWASFSNAVKKNLRKEFLLNSTSDVLGTNLAFMKVFSSAIFSELQKNFRMRNTSRKAARVFLNAIPQKPQDAARGCSLLEVLRAEFVRNRW